MIDHVAPNGSAAVDFEYLVPGMNELHIHGCLGYSVKDTEEEKAVSWLRQLARHGVTGVVVSPCSAPIDVMRASVDFFAGLMEKRIPGAAHILGIHLEGPFMNPLRRGGMLEQDLILPSVESYKRIAGGHEDRIRIVSMAPEMPGADEVIRYLTAHGVHVNAGHSDATAAQMRRAISLGVDGVTHFFNAARPIHHREPGLLTEALLTPGVFLEMISDQVHLAPEILKLVVQAAGARRVAMITDCVPLTGQPDGQYGDIIVKNGSPRLLDGTLAGSGQLMDQDMRGLIEIGIDPWDVFCMASNTPARRIALRNEGDIAPCFHANLLGLNEDFRVGSVFLDGEENPVD